MRKAGYALARHGQRASRRNARAFSAHSTGSLEPPVQITTLPNKIRVVTEATPGHFASVGLYVDAGPVYEKPESSGVSHFIDRLAFKVRLVWLLLRYPYL